MQDACSAVPEWAALVQRHHLSENRVLSGGEAPDRRLDLYVRLHTAVGLHSLREISDEWKVYLQVAIRQGQKEECPAIDTPPVPTRWPADQGTQSLFLYRARKHKGGGAVARIREHVDSAVKAFSWRSWTAVRRGLIDLPEVSNRGGRRPGFRKVYCAITPILEAAIPCAEIRKQVIRHPAVSNQPHERWLRSRGRSK